MTMTGFSVEKPLTAQLKETKRRPARRHFLVVFLECELTLPQLQPPVKDLMSCLKFYPPELRMQTTAFLSA